MGEYYTSFFSKLKIEIAKIWSIGSIVPLMRRTNLLQGVYGKNERTGGN